jgi:hypothetical protein
VIAILLLAMTQPPPAPTAFTQLHCEVAARVRSARREIWPVSVRLGIADGRIESVLLEGPAPFSSYTPAPGRKELLHKRDQWHGSFQKDAIRLRRTGIDRVDLVLEPKDGMAGAYSGFWTHVFTVEQRPIIVEGTIACRPVAGTSAGSGRP